MSINIVNSFKLSPVGGWKELARATGTPPLSVSGLSDKKYYMLLASTVETGAEGTRPRWRMNDDSGLNYAQRFQADGGADLAQTNEAELNNDPASGAVNPKFEVLFISSRAASEKLLLGHSISRGITGATEAPRRKEYVGKWSNTVSAINRIDYFDLIGNSWDATSQFVVLEWDPTDIHTDNFWEELASVNADGSSINLSSGTITAKKYLWIQCYLKNTTSHVSNMTFNNDIGNNYTFRESDNGATDVLIPSAKSIEMFGATTTPIFVNMFIVNNSANEKLVIGHTVNQNTIGAASTPNRREFVAKWTNVASQITEIDLDSTVGNWDSESIIKVWGSN